MEFVFFADLHAHNYKTFANPLPNGLTTRGMICVDVLKTVREYCVSKLIKYAVLAGDLFHIKGVIDVTLFNMIYREIEEFEKAHITLILIPGQHDLVSEKTGYANALECLPAMVISKPTVVWLDTEIGLIVIPYQTDLGRYPKILEEQIRAFNKSVTTGKRYVECYIVSHAAVTGAVVSEKFTMKGVDPKVFDVKGVSAVLLGDIHKRQDIELENTTIHYCGCVMQNNFGDRGQQKGFHVVKTGRPPSFEFVSVNTPKFKEVNAKEMKREDFVNSYVRVEVPEDVSREGVKSKLVEWEVKNYALMVAKRDFVEGGEVSDINVIDESKLICEWVEAQETKLDKERLVTIGSKIVEAGRDE